MPHLSASEWEQRFNQLELHHLELEKRYIESQERIAFLEAENRSLKEKLNTNSSNS